MRDGARVGVAAAPIHGDLRQSQRERALGTGHGFGISPDNAETLRRYCLNGGFVMVDDFWGDEEWDRFIYSMKRVFPDVRAGTRITGVYLGERGARFYVDGTLAGAIEDEAFARAFFAIWLDPRTSAPALRTALLSGAAPARPSQSHATVHHDCQSPRPCPWP